MTVGCSLTTPIRLLHSLRSLHRVAGKSYLVIAVALLSSLVYATEPPATKIDADELRHDEQKLVTEFRGNVSLNRGALSLQGDALELEQLPTVLFDLDRAAAARWTAPVAGRTSLSFAALEGSGAFTGVTADGTWLLTLICSTCTNPAPKAAVVLRPGGGRLGLNFSSL